MPPSSRLLLLVLVLTIAGRTVAQEVADHAPVVADPAANAASGDPAGDSAGGAALTEPGEKALAFARTMTEWKTLLGELRDLKGEYSIANTEELEGIQQRYVAKLEAGEKLVPRLRQAAREAYLEAPNADRELSRFLIKLIADDIKQDDYPSAKELAQVLVAGESEQRNLFDLAGIAAFGTNDFEMAEEMLKKAEASGLISEAGGKYLRSLPDAKATWVVEQELRQAEVEADDLPRVKLTTTAGDIVIELFENEAPETVGNFISLVEKGFYDGLTFHRVLQGFMAQCGCPNGDGTGGPGYKIYCECTNENHRNHFAGSLSMAKETARHTGGSQFFITFVPTPYLNGMHTVFGRVIEGMETLPKITKIDPEKSINTKSPTTITKAEVLRKRDHEYRPNKVK